MDKEDEVVCTFDKCHNLRSRGEETCRWHRPEVLKLRAEAEALRIKALKLAGVA